MKQPKEIKKNIKVTNNKAKKKKKKKKTTTKTEFCIPIPMNYWILVVPWKGSNLG